MVSEVVQLPSGVVPRSSANDCELKPLQAGANPTCEVVTTLGTYNNGFFNDGVHGKGRISKHFIYSGNTGLTFVSSNGWLGGYRTMKPNLLTYSNTQNGLQYTYSSPWEFTLMASNGQRASVGADSLAFSNNGRYGAVVATAGTGNGIMVFDTEKMQGRLIASLTSATSYDQTTPGAGNLAISDDGKFVASSYSESTTAGVEKGLRVYDTTTCKDQLLIASAKRNNCEYKNIWTGKMRGVQYGDGIQSLVSDAERPLNVRFEDVDTLSFSAIYDYQSATDFKAAKYEAKIGDGAAPHLGVLGMGDSYISGEGAYYYRSGTDNADNACHTSWLSYPYTQGTKYYPIVRSVACSGAMMDDITNKDGADYNGQTAIEKVWDKRSNQLAILNSLMPGYANQLQFASIYQPQVILLSIGGNDIGFGKVVKRCVGWDTCYATYEDRYELMQTIVDKYPDLVKTYTQVVSASRGARVYVVGYPQIVDSLGFNRCAANVHLNLDELRFASSLISYLNTVISQATAEAGVRYVSTEGTFGNNRLCGIDPARAVNGLTASLSNFGLVGSESFHPTALGQKLIGNSVAYQTNNFTTAMPVKTAHKVLQVDKSHALLSGRAKTGRPTHKVTWAQLIKTDYFIERGKSATINYGGQDIEPDTSVQIIINSEPTLLYEGVLDGAKKELEVYIPKSVEPGFHELHLYATNTVGETIDIRDILYVDDGTTLDNPCGVVPAKYESDGTQTDVDKDGVNDACDGEYADPTDLPEGVETVPAEEPFIEDTPLLPTPEPKSNEGNINNTEHIPNEPERGIEPEITAPDVVRVVSSVDQDEQSPLPDKQNEPTSATPLVAKVTPSSSNSQSLTEILNVATRMQAQAIAPIDVGTAVTQPVVLGVSNGVTQDTAPKTSKIAATPSVKFQSQDSGTHIYVVVCGVIVGVVLIIYFWRRKQSAML